MRFWESKRRPANTYSFDDVEPDRTPCNIDWVAAGEHDQWVREHHAELRAYDSGKAKLIDHPMVIAYLKDYERAIAKANQTT